MPRNNSFYIYILGNYERTVLYIGVSNNIIRRIIEHKNNFGSTFTKKYHLKYLLYFEQYQYVRDAIYREKEIKKWRREKKINLIKSTNPKLKDLSNELFDCYEISEKETNEIAMELKNNYMMDC